MRSHHRVNQVFASSAAVALMLTGCGPDADDGTGGPGGGDTESGVTTSMTVGLSNEPGFQAPGQATATVPLMLNGMVHRGLMAYDNHGELIEGLAESIETDDYQVWDVVLREDLEFSDGEPLTVENVRESFEYLSDPESLGYVNPGVRALESVEIVSDTELTFTLEQPNNAFLQYLAIPTAAVFPPELLENEEDTLESGAGPFKIDEWVQGQRIVMSKNENYHDADSVTLEEIELVFYSDGNARTNALLSGEVDLIDYVPWEDYDRIEADDNIVLDSPVGPFMFLLFNVEDDNPFSDPLMRQAVGYAVNRDNTVESGFSGAGEPIYGVVLDEDDPAYDPAWGEMYVEDMDHARELVEESGFDTAEEITFLANSQYQYHEDVALPIMADLDELGLNVNLVSPDWATRTELASSGEYDIMINGNVGQVQDAAYLSFFLDGAYSPSKSWGFFNEDLYDAVQAGMAAQTDEEKKESFDDARELWEEEVPYVIVNHHELAHAFNSDIEGFATLPGFLNFYSGYSFAYVE